MQNNSPKKSGFYQPAEWSHHQACWLAWPSHANLWQSNLPKAQAEFVALCQAITDMDGVSRKSRGEKLEILVPNADTRTQALLALKGLPVRFHLIPFGDIWVRDTAPIFLTNAQGLVSSVRFAFNGWGEKYVLPHDAEVSAKVQTVAEVKSFSYPWILEGGSIDVDGEGTLLTTRQCLLNPNRNPAMTQSQIEEGIFDAIGVSKILWLEDGLLNDHTDGHIDTIARFTSPGVVACMKALDPKTDPNHEVYEKMASDLESFTDAKGRKLKVERVPSPGKILNEDGDVMPASYMNFYIANTTVVVPTYGVVQDRLAVDAIAKLFPMRRVVGSSAIAILSGGGAFHCITQQQP